MARNTRGGRSRSSSSGNRGSDRTGGVIEIARDRPMAAAAVASGAAAAGLFLWSKRSQISNQLSNISEQIGEWTDNFGSGSSFDSNEDKAGLTTSTSSGNRSTSSRNRGMSETGGGNSTRGATSGGGGTTGPASGRGRAGSAAATQE